MNVQTPTEPVQRAYTENRFIYFDIETIPDQSPEALAREMENVTPPGNIKKPESIEKWLAENAENAAREAVAKTSFDGGRGHVCTIAWAKNDGPVLVRHAIDVDDERDVIADFFAAFDEYHSETLVGHNITGFDIGFLRKRAVVLSVEMPSRTSFPRDPKPWDRSIFDTMSAWAGGTNRISMNDLCEILGIDGKDGFDGSKVAAAWAAGEHEKIARYCKADVERTRAIHQRFIAAGY
jgi:3'-5' exonuclease